MQHGAIADGDVVIDGDVGMQQAIRADAHTRADGATRANGRAHANARAGADARAAPMAADGRDLGVGRDDGGGMNAGSDGGLRIEKSDHGARSWRAGRLRGSACGRLGNSAARSGSRRAIAGLRRRLAIADEGDLASPGGFERRRAAISSSPAPSHVAFKCRAISSTRITPATSACMIQTYAS